MSYNLTIVLPPRGSIVRELVFNAILSLANSGISQGHISYTKYTGRSITLTFLSQDHILRAFGTTIKYVKTLYKLKTERVAYRIPVHVNDRKVFKNIANLDPDGYLEGFNSMLDHYAQKLEALELSNLADVKVTGRRIVLGSGENVLLQPLAVERYETGTDFMHGIGASGKLEIKLSDEWYLLVSIGFMAEFLSYTRGEILLFSFTEDKMAEILGNFLPEYDIFMLSLAKVAGERAYATCSMHALYLLLALDIYEKLQEALTSRKLDIEKYLDKIGLLPTLLTRINYAARTFTLLERSNLELSTLLKFVHKLSQKGLGSRQRRQLEGALDRAMRGLGDLSRLGSYINFATLLHEAVNYAKDPFYTVYRAVREEVITDSRLVRGLIESLME